MKSTPASFVVFGRSPFARGMHVWHHIALRLAESSRVVYVQDPVRVSLRRLRSTIDRISPSMATLLPLDYPLQRVPLIARANIRGFRHSVEEALPRPIRPLVCILYPRASIDLALALEPDLCVYHATDDFSYTWDGQENTDFLAWEARALKECRLVIATQHSLGERYRVSGHPNVFVQTLGFDERTFDGRPRPVPLDMRNLPHPILGYAGSIYATKLDTTLIAAAARTRPHWTFLFIGEVFDDDARSIGSLKSLPNLHVIGLRPFHSIPAYVYSFDVAIHPQRKDPRGREFNFYALKVFDALAMGRAIVLTPSSSLVDLLPHASFASDLESFIREIEAAIATGNSDQLALLRRQMVSGHSWGLKVHAILQEVEKALA